MRLILLSLAVLGFALAPSLAAAQAAADGSDPARQAFEEGRAHFDDGRFLLAAEAFERAYGLMREGGMPNAWMILFNVGTSLDEIRGREQDARDAYAGYLEGALAAEDQTGARIALVQSRIRELDLRLEVAARAGAGPGTDATPTTTMSPVGPIVLGGGGAILLAAAITAGVLAAENDALLATCTDGVCPASSRAQAESVHGLAIATDVLWISGAVAAGTGLVLTLLLRDTHEAPPAVSAGCGPTGCGIQVRGTL